MGGKSFYCDYCECFMKNDINVRQNHGAGTAHNIAKANYIQRYKDPQQIITEEKVKTPCKRISNNLECSFGFFCRFSHYSSEELNYLQFIVDEREYKKERHMLKKTPLIWNSSKTRKKLPPVPIPPSLQPIDFEKMTDSCFESQWG
ncbi:zinc finger matrin-type protein 5 [Eupeodes corollae]|uniref:zinc finger matrin-type protein 5 n=1 Tax=Eupeodes corollae TaxID=290404 RepID=UPI0024910C7C|nr:zinc finger matrin-type protein 5 [Eupeodes corollae]